MNNVIKILIIIISVYWYLLVSAHVLAQGDNATYTYDNLNRITSITFQNGTTINYTYDEMGNRTQVVIVCSPSGC